LNAMEKLLELSNIGKSFGGLTALEDVSFSVAPGQITSLIGPNGAGKTTLYHIITGFHVPSRGHVLFRQEKINGLKPHVITRKGIARTFQNVELFSNMTVLENVMMGYHVRTKAGLFSGAFKLPRAQRERGTVLDKSMALLDFIDLKHRAYENSGGLPFGLQRYVEIARALATGPQLLLLDEPASGLDPTESHSLAGLISRIRDRGTAILLVEHNMDVAMEISDHIVVLNYGKNIAEGSPREIQNNADVITAYLGGTAPRA